MSPWENSFLWLENAFQVLEAVSFCVPSINPMKHFAQKVFIFEILFKVTTKHRKTHVRSGGRAQEFKSQKQCKSTENVSREHTSHSSFHCSKTHRSNPSKNERAGERDKKHRKLPGPTECSMWQETCPNCIVWAYTHDTSPKFTHWGTFIRAAPLSTNVESRSFLLFFISRLLEGSMLLAEKRRKNEIKTLGTRGCHFWGTLNT